MISQWTHQRLPTLDGTVAIVTGSNSGIGFQAARSLAAAGAMVVLACRNEGKARAAINKMGASELRGSVEFARLDLSDLASVSAFAAAIRDRFDHLHLLINNAGVMMPREREQTKDGFELQFGVNHLGHFALTAHLFPLIANTPGARVVTVSSQAHRQGTMAFEDLNWETRRYKRMASYGQSKLANLLFTFELQRRIERAGVDASAVAAHPGWTATDLQRHVASFDVMNRFFAMKPEQGALPTLRAAADPDVVGGEYFGPSGFYEMRGYPVKVGSTREARDEGKASRLWEISEKLTGIRFDIARERS